MKKFLLMGKKIRTSVVLTEKAERILTEHRGLGLMGPLSVGLELFDQLPEPEKRRRVTAIENEEKQKRAANRAQRVQEGQKVIVRAGVQAGRLQRRGRHKSGE